MMVWLMVILWVLYIAAVLYFVQKAVLQIYKNSLRGVDKKKKNLKQLMKKQQAFRDKKVELEKETLEIFALYEITKDISKSLTEEEAFDIFKGKLREYISFGECLFFDPLSAEVKELEKIGLYTLVPLQGKKEKIGVLAINGVSEEDKEKLVILCQQFSLALRRVKLYQEIQQIAITDSLTELYTRKYTLERFAEEIVRSKNHQVATSILMLDVDFFKRINDTYGHLTGDQILQEIGHIIRSNIREIDIAGRYGGEEFFIVLPDTDKEGALFAAERIRRAANQAAIKAYDTTLKVTVSIGMATFPSDGKTINDLIEKADFSLYRAKKTGRNKICAPGIEENGPNM